MKPLNIILRNSKRFWEMYSVLDDNTNIWKNMTLHSMTCSVYEYELYIKNNPNVKLDDLFYHFEIINNKI